MPISFPFFARRSPGSGASASAPACQVPLAKLPPAAPTGRLLPEAGPSQSLLQRPNPHLETAVPLTSPAPLRPLTGDLTAQAVHQCELPAPLPSGLAASVLGTQSAAPNERSNGCPSPQLPTPTPAEAPGPAWPPIKIPFHELAQLRHEVREEVEMVRSDLFGAAMGVSALKDRLDGLEAHVRAEITGATSPTAAGLVPTSPASGATSAQLEGWTDEWLEARLQSLVQAAVDKALAAAMADATAALSSTDFFRLPVGAHGIAPEALFSQAPLVLSSHPS